MHLESRTFRPQPRPVDRTAFFPNATDAEDDVVTSADPEKFWRDLQSGMAPWSEGEAAKATWRQLISNTWKLVDTADAGDARVLLLRRSKAGRAGLTARQHEVLRRLLDGSSARAIAVELGIPPSSVSLRMRAGLRALGLRSREELIWLCGPDRAQIAAPPRLRVVRLRTHSGDVAVLAFGLRGELVSTLPPALVAVAAAIIEGRSLLAIARARGTSPATVANQIAMLRDLLEASSRYEIVARARAWAQPALPPDALPTWLVERFSKMAALSGGG